VTDEVVLIRSIKDESIHVYELYMSTMGECMGKIIRWPQTQTQNKQLRHILIPNLIRHQSCTQTTSPTSMSMASNEFQEDSMYNGLFVHSPSRCIHTLSLRVENMCKSEISNCHYLLKNPFNLKL
jgi:hypothetical protein